MESCDSKLTGLSPAPAGVLGLTTVLRNVTPNSDEAIVTPVEVWLCRHKGLQLLPDRNSELDKQPLFV